MTELEQLKDRILHLEERISQLEQLVASKPQQRKTGAGRPSTITDLDVAMVAELLAAGETVRAILEELHISRDKYYAIKQRLARSDNSESKKQNKTKAAEPDLLETVNNQLFFGGKEKPTAKTWLKDFKRVATWLKKQKTEVTAADVERVVRALFDEFFHPQQNKRHDKLLRDLLANFA